LDHAHDIIDYWFGKQPYTAGRLDERMAFWFGNAGSRESPANKDNEIRQRFGAAIQRAAGGELDSWADSPRRRLALIILLDQFPRNVYRGTAQAYAADRRAAGLALEGLHTAADATLAPVERIFFYMPLQHAESLELQDESVAATRRLLTEAPAGMEQHFASMLRFAELHRRIIAEFGRFPHRNRMLGRQSTPGELKFLRDGGPRFGS
jgi:uncharacterized protein (DUF924 family)